MRPKLIILVENDMNLRQSIVLMLQRAGFLVSATDCVYTALDLLRSRPYQLIISDINIPETSQVLIPKIFNTYPNLSLVILTDQIHQDLPKEDKLLSAHYLVKPLAPERLLDCVGKILGRTVIPDQENNRSYPGLQR
jgi:DNA-binding NtrC family response regulator